MAIKVALRTTGYNPPNQFFDPLTGVIIDHDHPESPDLTGLNLEGIVDGVRQNDIYVSEGHIGYKIYNNTVGSLATVIHNISADKGYRGKELSLVNDGPGSMAMYLNSASADLIVIKSGEPFTEDNFLPFDILTITNLSTSATSYRLFCI